MKENKSHNNQKDDYIDFSQIFQPNYSFNREKTEKIYNSLIKSPEHLCHLLKTDIKKGISTKNMRELNWRVNIYGTNKSPTEKPLRIIDFILECFEDTTLKVLLISSIVSLIIGLLKDGLKTGWIEGSAILGAVFIVTGISSTLNYNEQFQFQKLKEENKKKKAIVIRNGIEIEINDEELLVGDLLILKLGDIISVDGILISSNFIITDESAINGESNPIKKTSKFSSEFKNGRNISPILISGTKIIENQGKMIVCAVGNKSFNGRNSELLSKENKKNTEENLTPLKKQLNDLANLIGQFGYIMAGLIGGVIILKDISLKIINRQSILVYSTLDTIINAFILAITVIVVAIPEGLPMAVTISLAYSLGQMKKEKNLVKNLNSSETMGNVNNICTDKTGTLTKGQMVVESFWFKGKDYKENEFRNFSFEEKNLFFENICNNITVVETSDNNGKKLLNGDMTEKALYNFMINNRFNKNIFYKGSDQEKYVLNFNSDNKFMCTLIKENNYNYKFYIKGAYEKVIPLIKTIRIGNSDCQIFDKYREEILNIIKNYSLQSKRTLIFASKNISITEFNYANNLFKEKNIDFFKSLYNGLNFEFLMGIRDQLRPDVRYSVIQCQKAGINVRMVTGDNIMTALAISKDSDIISENQFNEALEDINKYRSIYRNIIKTNLNNSSYNESKSYIDKTSEKISLNELYSPIALEGEQFRLLSGNLTKIYDEKTHKIISIQLNNIEMFKKITKRLKVIARATPEDKFLLVFGLKQIGNIIAVTGDGTNDAPALKEAHVGFAMGIRGTDVAQQAADILLLDDSFSSIVTACKFGRNVYDSIRKFIQFQLTTNIVSVFMTFLGGIFLKDSPLNAIQMLWVNLIMDSFASLALSTEKPNDKLLNRKPYKRNSSILTIFMKINIISQGLFQMIILLFILFKGDRLFGVNSDKELEHYEWDAQHGYHFTIFFDVFVFLQVFNSINARKLNPYELNVFKGIKDNIYYIIVQIFIIVGQIFLVNFGGRAVRTKPLSIYQHLCCMLIASFSLIIGFLIKLIPIDMKEMLEKNNDEKNEENEEEKIRNKRNSKNCLKKLINLNKIGDLIFHKNKIDKKKNPLLSSRNLQNDFDINLCFNNDKKLGKNKKYIQNDLFNQTKEKNLLEDGNNSISEEKLLLVDLLSEDSKSNQNSSNQIIDIKDNFENGKNDFKIEKEEKMDIFGNVENDKNILKEIKNKSLLFHKII